MSLMVVLGFGMSANNSTQFRGVVTSAVLEGRWRSDPFKLATNKENDVFKKIEYSGFGVTKFNLLEIEDKLNNF